MKERDSGEAKGYAFVMFRSKELASRAIEELNNTEFKVPNCRFSLPAVSSVGCYLVYAGVSYLYFAFNSGITPVSFE